MENLNEQQNLSVAAFDPVKTYAGASSLRLSESEMKALSAPFDDLDYDLTPQGFVFLPQAISLKRINDVIGIGQWSILLINTGSQEVNLKDNKKLVKVFYDGALIVRGCFVSRAAGEASYTEDNGNQSYATALEAARTDCRQRCSKDLGVALDAWNPSFVRRWRKEHGIRVYVMKGNNKIPLWRRKDLDPFDNEVGLVPTSPTVPSNKAAENDDKNPWLNHGPDYDKALKELLEGKTISELLKDWRVSKSTREDLTEVLKREWEVRLRTVNNMQVLTDSYNENKNSVDEYSWLKEMFTEKRKAIQGGKVKQTA